MKSQESYIRQIVDYIKKNLAKGYTLESLKWALINQGYGRLEITKAIEITNQELALQAPKLVEKPVIKVEIEPVIQKKSSLFSRILNLLK